METQSTENTVALIFGASGGIGAEVCRRLHRSGSRIALVARNADRLRLLAEELPGSAVIEADVRSSESVKQAFSMACELLGPPSQVAHCVGSILLKPAHQLRQEEWDETIALNLTSAFYVLKEATSLWIRDHTPASLVFCSSAAASIGLANHEAIAAAKAGIEGLVRSAAATYATRGIRINAVAPGLVKTELSSKIWSSEMALKASLSLHPTRTLGTAAQVASGIHWLLSSEQSWITGEILHIDGGLAQLKTLGSP